MRSSASLVLQQAQALLLQGALRQACGACSAQRPLPISQVAAPEPSWASAQLRASHSPQPAACNTSSCSPLSAPEHRWDVKQAQHSRPLEHRHGTRGLGSALMGQLVRAHSPARAYTTQQSHSAGVSRNLHDHSCNLPSPDTVDWDHHGPTIKNHIIRFVKEAYFSYDPDARIVSLDPHKTGRLHKSVPSINIWGIVEPDEDLMENELPTLHDPDEVVITKPEIRVAISFPFHQEYCFSLNADKPAVGFTRAEFVLKLAHAYYHVYRVEHRLADEDPDNRRPEKGIMVIGGYWRDLSEDGLDLCGVYYDPARDVYVPKIDAGAMGG